MKAVDVVVVYVECGVPGTSGWAGAGDAPAAAVAQVVEALLLLEGVLVAGEVAVGLVK